MPPRFIARQLSCPTGILGRFVGLLMNRHNARMNAFAVQQLQLAPSDRLLEVGFGGGINLPRLIAGAGFVYGLDLSRDVVQRAKARFSDSIAAHRADFLVGSVESLPFAPGSFEKVCTVNSVYFWKSLHSGFAEISRVLVPGGRVVIGFLPKEWMDRGNFPSDIFTARAPAEVVDALTEAAFKSVRIERPDPATRWNVIVATR